MYTNCHRLRHGALLGPAVRNRKSPQHFLVVCCHQQDVYRRWCPPSLQLLGPAVRNRNSPQHFLVAAAIPAWCHQQDVNRRWCFFVIRPACVPTRLQRYKLREQELLDPECNRMQRCHDDDESNYLDEYKDDDDDEVRLTMAMKMMMMMMTTSRMMS